MSEQNGRYAHSLLLQKFSNLPPYEKLSARVRGSLEKVGGHFIAWEEMDKKLAGLEAQILMQAAETELFLVEELGQLAENKDDPLNESNVDKILEELGLLKRNNPEPDDEDFSAGKPTLH